VTGRYAHPSPAGVALAPVQTPDEDLLRQIAVRDAEAETALAVLYDRYGGTVYGLGRRMLGDAGAAEDLLQETFWRVWQHAAQFDPRRARLSTWMLRIAWNLAASELRRQGRRPRLATPGAGQQDDDPREDAEPVDPAPDVPDQVWLSQQRRLVFAGLQQLPEAQRQAVLLAYFRGLKQIEIAAVQGAPLSTVKTRLALGLRKLADYLQANGLRPSAEEP
jgi:RNA polymerase sigma-70 factor, ECF subfamily